MRARGPGLAAPRPDRRGRGRLGCHVDGELVGARHPADPGRCAPEDPARDRVGLGGVRAGPGRAGGGPAAGGPGAGDHRRGPGAARGRRRGHQGRCAGDLDRVRRPPRRQGAPDPGEADPGRGGSGGRGGSRSQGVGARGAGGRGGGGVPDARGRPREGAREVHHPRPRGRTAAPVSCLRSPRRSTAPAWTAGHQHPGVSRRAGWGRRSASWSWAIPLRTPRTRAAPRPPWW